MKLLDFLFARRDRTTFEGVLIGTASMFISAWISPPTDRELQTSPGQVLLTAFTLVSMFTAGITLLHLGLSKDGVQ